MLPDNQELNAQDPATAETIETAAGISRRAIVGTSVASVLGLALGKLGAAPAEAQVASTELPEGSVMLLPPSLAAPIVPFFMQDPNFAMLHKAFSGQGFQFIPERAKVSVYMGPAGAPGTAPTCAGIHIILPSYRPVDAAAPNHEAVSLVGVCFDQKVGGAAAAKVVVNHRPYRLSSMSFFDVFTTGEIIERSATRDQVKSLSVDQLAALLGPPAPDDPNGVPAPNMDRSQLRTLASGAYRRLLYDAYARPNYPAAGFATMLADTDMVQKWAEVQSARFSVGGSIGWCSCSTSSNACTSTSSCIVIDIKL